MLTFDHEHVPGELLDKLVAEGVNVAPPPQALVHAQDKLVMRRRLESLGVPVPRYAEINSLDELDAFARRVGGPVVVKAVRGGYDATRCTPGRSRPPSWPTACRCWPRNR